MFFSNSNKFSKTVFPNSKKSSTWLSQIYIRLHNGFLTIQKVFKMVFPKSQKSSSLFCQSPKSVQNVFFFFFKFQTVFEIVPQIQNIFKRVFSQSNEFFIQSYHNQKTMQNCFSRLLIRLQNGPFKIEIIVQIVFPEYSKSSKRFSMNPINL